jgi:fructose/tagatose bisphosphate aldolase
MLSFYVKQNAEKGGYAVGAFNVYNLEGIEAVVAAAEEENSPAILQVSVLTKSGFLIYNSNQRLTFCSELFKDVRHKEI